MRSKLTKICLLISLLLLSTLKIPAQTFGELKQQLVKTKDERQLQKLNDKLGREYFNQGNFPQAMKHFIRSLKLAEKIGDKHSIGAENNNISAVYFEIGKKEPAIQHAQKAIKIFSQLKDKIALANAYNSLANAYYSAYEDSLAFVYFQKTIPLRKAAGDSIGLVAAYKNLGMAYYDLDSTAKAIQNLKLSLLYSQKLKDTLESFATVTAITQFYTYNKQLDSAEVYFKEYLPLVNRISSYHRLKYFYYSLAAFQEDKGDYKGAVASLKLFQQYSDSVINIESNAQIQELQTRYDTEKKEIRIKNQQRSLEEERRTRYILFALFAVIVLVMLFFIFWLRGRQKLKIKDVIHEQQEMVLRKIIEAQELERSRIAKELHDGIVQDLTVLKMNARLGEGGLAYSFTGDLDKIIKELRELSYQMMPVALQQLGLEKALEELFFKSFTSNNIAYEFSCFDLDERLPEKIEVSLYRICQELINNTLKHAGATFVSVVLNKKQDYLSLVFEDNGKGFEIEKIKRGIGLDSLSSRIEYIKGKIEFDSDENAGTRAFIRIPL